MKKKSESKSLIEVRNWKKAVAKDTKGLRTAEIVSYFNKYAKSKKQKAA
jgi:hypothetical protein